MASKPYITGAEAKIVLFVDAQPIAEGLVTDYNRRPVSEEELRGYLGNTKTQSYFSHDGWEGDFEVDQVSPGSLDDAFENLIDSYHDRTPYPNIMMSETILSRSGEAPRTYIFTDIVFRFERGASGKNEALKGRINWKAPDRVSA